MLAVTFCVNFWTTVPKSLLGFFEEKLKTSVYVHFGLLYTFSDQKKNYPIHISKVKGRTFRFQQNKYTYLIITNNTRNNRTNDRSKFMEKLKQAIPTKWDKWCGMMGQNQQNICVRYFSCCINVTGFFPTICLNLTNVWL